MEGRIDTLREVPSAWITRPHLRTGISRLVRGMEPGIQDEVGCIGTTDVGMVAESKPIDGRNPCMSSSHGRIPPQLLVDPLAFPNRAAMWMQRGARVVFPSVSGSGAQGRLVGKICLGFRPQMSMQHLVHGSGYQVTWACRDGKIALVPRNIAAVVHDMVSARHEYNTHFSPRGRSLAALHLQPTLLSTGIGSNKSFGSPSSRVRGAGMALVIPRCLCFPLLHVETAEHLRNEIGSPLNLTALQTCISPECPQGEKVRP